MGIQGVVAFRHHCNGTIVYIEEDRVVGFGGSVFDYVAYIFDENCGARVVEEGAIEFLEEGSVPIDDFGK